MEVADCSASNSSLCDDINFEEFCVLCESLQSLKQNKKRQTEVLSKYISGFRTKVENAHRNQDSKIFPIMRLLLPQSDRDRGAYGIKENKLAKILIKIIGLPKTSIDANKLLNFKAPTSLSDGSSDFANVVFYVVKSRLPQMCVGLSVSELNKSLDLLADMNANNKPREMENELSKLISLLTAVQIKWLIRVILKDMKLGMSQDRILRCFHDDAPDLFDSCNNLSKVCEVLKDRNTRLNEIEIQIFSPCSAMLSKKLEISSVENLFKQNKAYHIENKFDGERFQMHMKDGKFKYFSRNGYDFTNTYGSTFQSDGLLTKYLDRNLNPSIKSFILDGEMMGWHKYNHCFGSKGMSFDIKKITENSVFRPCFCVFDIILHNDQVITNIPLSERLIILDKLFSDQEGVIIHSTRTKVSTVQEVMDALNKVINDQDEGLILKDVNSFYKPKSRNSGWYKIKPEYGEGVMSELDMIIIGGNYAENKSHGLVNSFLLGLAVPPEVVGTAPKLFNSVGKVSTGLTHEELETLCERLAPHWQPVMKDKNWTPPNIKWTKDKPDLWIDPAKSVILQIKATELVRSDSFASYYTLRFPRIEKIRFDKPWEECMSVPEFEELTKEGRYVQKLTKRHVNTDDLFASKVIKLPQKQTISLLDVTQVSCTLSGKEICVLSGDDKSTKEALESLILQMSGRVTQNPGPVTWAAIAGTKTTKVNNVEKKGGLDVLHAWWLRDIHQSLPSEIVPPPLAAYIAMGPETADRIALEYDRFGDSFTEPADEDSLLRCVHNYHEKNESIYLLPEELTELEIEIFGHINEYSFMRHIYAYFHEPDEVSINIQKMQFLMYSGNMCNCQDESLTHIVFDKDSNIHTLNDLLSKNSLDVPVVNKDWISACVRAKSIIAIDHFMIEREEIM